MPISRITPSILFAAAVLVATISTPARAQDQFPDGPGMDILRTKCRVCHMADRVTQVAGKTAEGWKTLVDTMMSRGAAVTEDEVPVLIEYLAKNWPVDKKIAVASFAPLAPMATHVKAEFTEWDVPTPATQPQDPLAAADGSIWYSGQKANVLGRLDPNTGEIKEFKLKTQGSGPDGLAEDRDGNIWYTAKLTGQLGKLD